MNERLVGLTSAEVKANMTRIEPKSSYSDEIASELGKTVFGQDKATKAVGRRLALMESGLGDPNKPLGSMFFLGPTGVGKTEMAHAAARYMFGDPESDRLRIINMAEFTEEHYITRFVGSPPSYVGYGEQSLIPHDWLHKGRSVVVLDEFEKAHPKIRQLFLGVLDKGTMEARNGSKGGETLHFNNSLVIFTSNIAGQEIHRITEGKQGIGFNRGEVSAEEKSKRIQAEATKGLGLALSPEFVNRIDDVVVFEEIGDPELLNQIITKFIDQKNNGLLYQRGVESPFFAVTQEFRGMVLELAKGKGGRELKRILDRELFDRAADVFMSIDVKGRPIVADFDTQTVFYTSDIEAPVEQEIVSLEELKKKDITEEPLRLGTGDNTDGSGESTSDTNGNEEKTKEAGSLPEETDCNIKE